MSPPAFASVMRSGGLYVLRGAKICPQAVLPLFTCLSVAATGRGRSRWLAARLAVMGGHGEERVGEHRQRDVPVPGIPFADLIVVQAGLVLSLGEAVLDRPPRAGQGDQLGQRCAGRGVTEEERQLALALVVHRQGTAGHQVTLRAGGGDQRPVIQPRPLGAVPARQHLPPPGGDPRGGGRSSARSFPAAVACAWLHGTAIT